VGKQRFRVAAVFGDAGGFLMPRALTSSAVTFHASGVS